MEAALRKSLPKMFFSKSSNILSTFVPKSGGDVLSDLCDEDLVVVYKGGNDQAFRVLLGRYEKPLFNFIIRFLGNYQLAEEAFQEVFLKVIRSVNDYRPSAKFSTWVYTITRNYCIDLSRKQKFRRHLSLEETPGDQGVALCEKISNLDANIESQVSAGELEKIVHAILAELNTEQREVFLMRETQGLQFDEIATITKVSTNTVKSRMRYALQAIQKRLSELNIDGEHVL